MSTASEGGLQGRFISPSRAELARLRAPMNQGEWRVLDFLDQHLPLEWEIYVQPHMNNLRPDIVLLNPNVGVAVYEVKNWNLAAMDWRAPANESTDVIYGTDATGKRIRKQDPFDRLKQYRDEIATLYCPRLGQGSGLASITAGVIVPRASDAELHERFGRSLRRVCASAKARRYWVCAGRDSLEAGRIDLVLPDHARDSSMLMNESLAQDLRHWLVEPDFSAEQRETPPLSIEQRRLVARGTDTGYRRLRGPAGSGKTMVLAARAARLAEEGRDVLVVSFNLTLLNYLQDCAVRFGCPRNEVTWFHFHGWCKRVMLDAGLGDEYDDLWRTGVAESVLAEALPQAVSAAIERFPESVARYDAILVDEGQNMRPNWWSALRKVLKRNGEMLLVADRAQDVYGRNALWTEQTMEGAGFRGPWASLEPSFRMPARLTKLMAQYVDTYLRDSEITAPEVPQGQLDVDVANLTWQQTTKTELAARCAEAVFELLERSPADPVSTAAFADVVLLVDSTEIGQAVVKALAERNVKVLSTFSDDTLKRRQQKIYFFKGDSRVKATTLHSFQGWEGRCLVVGISHASTDVAKHGVYTALTRLKAHPRGSFMSVVCAAPELATFGQSWNGRATDIDASPH